MTTTSTSTNTRTTRSPHFNHNVRDRLGFVLPLFHFTLATNAAAATTSSNTAREGEDAREGRRLTVPEDGYEWKKYGQKFIKSVRKYRAYFKCREKRCKVKKRAEWPPSDLSSIKITYVGVHDHPPRQPQSSSEQEASARMANRYNLANQVLGSSSDPP